MLDYLQHIPEWMQYIALFFFSTLKSYYGSSLSAILEFPYFNFLIINFSGALVSIILSYRFRNLILNLIKRKDKKTNGYSKKLKRSLVFWKKYGIYGIAFISPVIISIPLGVIVSAHFKTSKKMIFTSFSISAFTWMNFFYLVTKFGLLKIIS